MDARAGKATISAVSVRQGETIKLPSAGPKLQEISCEDIARLALAMHDHRYYFSIRRDLDIKFARDLNGGGMQALYIKKNNEMDPLDLVQILFDYTHAKDGQFLYESDLIMDHGKDYEPTVNFGKHRFFAYSATIQVDWVGVEIQQWLSDIDRLLQSPKNLTDWIDSDLDILVRCRSGFQCRKPEILSKKDIKMHVAEGLNIEELKRRLRCSKCGKLGASIEVF